MHDLTVAVELPVCPRDAPNQAGNALTPHRVWQLASVLGADH